MSIYVSFSEWLTVATNLSGLVRGLLIQCALEAIFVNILREVCLGFWWPGNDIVVDDSRKKLWIFLKEFLGKLELVSRNVFYPVLGNILSKSFR